MWGLFENKTRGRNPELRKFNCNKIIEAGRIAINSQTTPYEKYAIGQLATASGSLLQDTRLIIHQGELPYCSVELDNPGHPEIAVFKTFTHEYSGPELFLIPFVGSALYEGSGFGSAVMQLGFELMRKTAPVYAQKYGYDEIIALISDIAEGGLKGNKGWSTNHALRLGAKP